MHFFPPFSFFSFSQLAWLPCVPFFSSFSFSSDAPSAQDRLPLLVDVLVDALFLEDDLLLLEGTVTLIVDLGLRQLVDALHT